MSTTLYKVLKHTQPSHQQTQYQHQANHVHHKPRRNNSQQNRQAQHQPTSVPSPTTIPFHTHHLQAKHTQHRHQRAMRPSLHSINKSRRHQYHITQYETNYNQHIQPNQSTTSNTRQQPKIYTHHKPKSYQPTKKTSSLKTFHTSHNTSTTNRRS